MKTYLRSANAKAIMDSVTIDEAFVEGDDDDTGNRLSLRLMAETEIRQVRG